MTTWPDRPEMHTPDVTGRPDEPWLPRAAIEWLEAEATSRFDAVLEIGTGASTIWLAKRVPFVLAVEDDLDWLRRVGNAVREAGTQNVVLTYAPEPESVLQLLDLVDMRVEWLCILDGGDRARWLTVLKDKLSMPVLVDNAERYDCAHAFGRFGRTCRVFTHGVEADGAIWRAELWE